MSLLESAIGWSKELEFLLEDGLRARGKGLHEKLSSVESQVPEGLVKKIRFVASVRNKLVHEHDYQLDQPEAFANVAQQSIEQLKALIAITASNPHDIRPATDKANEYAANAVEAVDTPKAGKERRKLSWSLGFWGILGVLVSAPLRLFKRMSIALLLCYLVFTGFDVIYDAKRQTSPIALIGQQAAEVMQATGLTRVWAGLAEQGEQWLELAGDKVDAVGLSHQQQQQLGSLFGKLFAALDRGVRAVIILLCRVVDGLFNLGLPAELSWQVA